MAIDKSNVDAYGAFSKYVRMGRRKATTHGGEWAVPCVMPGCSSRNDALQLWPYRTPDADGNVTHFWCRRCNQHGDIIKFVQLVKGCTLAEACRELNIPYSGKYGSYSPKPKEMKAPAVNLDESPSDVWSMKALSFARECQQVLWKSEIGKAVLNHLRSRGFTDETIKSRGYGYNPGNLQHKPGKSPDRFDPIGEWGVYEGKAVWLPRGIVIPWLIDGTIWKLSIRRRKDDLERDIQQGMKPRKYVAVKGGSNGLYRADTIVSGKPLFLFEGEFNADMLAQTLAEAGITDVSIVATGSTDKGRADNWLIKIAKASPILFSFDPDNGGAEAIKEYWSKVLPQGLPWPSIGGDLNEMYLAGKDIVKWVNRGLKIAGSSAIVDDPVAGVATQVEDLPEHCSVCGKSVYEYATEDFYYDATGKLYCDEHSEIAKAIDELFGEVSA